MKKKAIKIGLSSLDLTLQEHISSHFKEHELIMQEVSKTFGAEILQIAFSMARAIERGGKIVWVGNGGSAADSQHLAAELVGRFATDRKPLNSIALTTDTSVITCIANDYSYQEIFSRQIEGLCSKKDLLVALSTSGNSPNVLNAMIAANQIGIETIALLGKKGGNALALADIAVVVPSNSTARIQESHITIGHILCDLVEKLTLNL